jgi:hypothetical protein
MAPKLAVLSFIKSVLAAGAAGTALGTFVIVVLFQPPLNSEGAVFLAEVIGMAAALSFSLVLIGAFLFGLPMTFVLRYFRQETATAYIVSGAVWGFLLPLIILLWEDAVAGHWMALLGAVAGAAAGRVWGRTFRKRFTEPVPPRYGSSTG